MEYTEVRISIVPFTEDNADWVVAEIESLGYESFCIQESCLLAYIPSSRFDFGRLTDALEVFAGHLELEVSHAPVPEQNWNAIWESSFEPIVVDGECTIKATFHKGLPETRYNITIDPKMAFGTGHHQTTYLMASSLMRENVAGRSVLDMGCGTGILAILAAKMGALSPVDAIDIDGIASDSALENAGLNGVGERLSVKCGDASVLETDERYDIVMANINRNILMADIPSYARVMHHGGVLLVSGFYVEDIAMLSAVAEKCGLEYSSQRNREDWAVVRFVKK